MMRSPLRNTPRTQLSRIFAGLLCCAFATQLAAQAEDLPATVQVIDPATNRPVPDASLILIETRKKYFTDARGEARIVVPATGNYTLRVILSDGRIFQPRVAVQSAGQRLTVYAGDRPDDSGDDDSGIQVSGRRGEQKLSRHRVRLDEIKRIPGQFGEALRGIESLPGVSAPPFGDGEISIRGANEGDNTYLVDDLPIGYPFHFLPTNSVLHNDLISTIDIYTGAYPANFGDATGGIIAISTIDEVERFGGNASFSLWSANALFKAPIGSVSPGEATSQAFGDSSGVGQADGEFDGGEASENAEGSSKEAGSASSSGPAGYWIGAARGSYLDKTLASLAQDGVRLPVYWDAQFKAKYRLNPRHTIYGYALAAKDTFGAEIQDTPEYDPTKDVDPVFVGGRIALDRAFHTEALRYIYQPGSKLQARVTALYHENITFIDGKLGDLELRQELQDGYVSGRADIDWDIVRDHVLLQVGGELRSFQYRNNGRTARQTDPADENPDLFANPPDFVTIPVRDSFRAQYNSGFAMLVLSGWGLEFKPGARVEHFQATNQSVVDPRGTLSYTLPVKVFGGQTTLLGGAGVFHRLPDRNQFSPSSGNPDLKFERAEHYAGGVQYERQNWLIKVEAFRHYFSDLVVNDSYITAPWRENQDPFDRYKEPILYNDPLAYSNDGTGFSEGYEIYLKKSKPPQRNGWFGWLSYTWSRSIRNDHQHIITEEEKLLLRTADETRIALQYDNTKDVYADFDRTHIINLVFGYKLSPEWQLGARWRYQTASPYTKITGDDGGQQFNRGRRIFDPKFSDLKNSERLKPFHRLDIRIDRFFNYEWGYGNFYFEMLNVYLRRNEDDVQWDSKRPFSATNPETVYDFLLLEQKSGDKKYILPFFNIGIEMKF
ncbi:MAG: TonB-dependent receptor [bacterium]|nr:TonB-dependent receptor [bacterium]